MLIQLLVQEITLHRRWDRCSEVSSIALMMGGAFSAPGKCD